MTAGNDEKNFHRSFSPVKKNVKEIDIYKDASAWHSFMFL